MFSHYRTFYFCYHLISLFLIIFRIGSSFCGKYVWRLNSILTSEVVWLQSAEVSHVSEGMGVEYVTVARASK